jgi:hypothetical protein
MNTKQIRLATTASTRENTNTATREKNTTPKTQIIKDVKQKEKLNMLFNKPTVMDASSVLSRDRLTIEGVKICNRIYWTF